MADTETTKLSQKRRIAAFVGDELFPVVAGGRTYAGTPQALAAFIAPQVPVSEQTAANAAAAAASAHDAGEAELAAEDRANAAAASAAQAAAVIGTKTSGLGDWSPESAVWIRLGDSTTEAQGGAGYGFDTITSKWRVPGMPLAGLLGVVNFGGSGYRLRNFVTDAIQAGFTGPTGDLPGVSAGPGQWDYYGHKPGGAVSLDTSLDWRGKLPSRVKTVVWSLCFGINDLILYNDVGTGTPAQIGAYIAGYLTTAVQKIQAKFPNDLVVLRMPNTMTSRPYIPAAGFPSQAAYPTFGNDANADATLVDNWNKGLAIGYLAVQSTLPRTVLVDIRDVFGHSSTTLTSIPAGNQTAGATVNGNPLLSNLVHPSPQGYDQIVHAECNALVGTEATRRAYNPARYYADMLVSQGYSGSAWDNNGLYFKGNDSYKRLASYTLVGAGANYMDVGAGLSTFQSVIGGAQNGFLYVQVGERQEDAFAFSLGQYSSVQPTALGANTRLINVAVPAGAWKAGSTVTFYTDAAPAIIPSGNLYLIGIVSKSTQYRYQAVCKIVTAGNGFFDLSIYPNQNHISSRYFQPTAAMALAIGGNTNATISLGGFTKSMQGLASQRTIRLFKSGTDFTNYLGADAVVLWDDNAPSGTLQELESTSYAAGPLVQGTSIFVATRTRMTNGLGSIAITPTLLVPNPMTVAVYRHTGNARTLIATLTVPANSSGVTGVSGTDFTAIASVNEAEMWEGVPTSATGVPAGCAWKMSLIPA